MTVHDFLNAFEVQSEYRIAFYNSKKSERIFLTDNQKTREKKIAYVYVDLGILVLEVEEEDDV